MSESISAVAKLLKTLDECVGNDATGYYGAVKVKPRLIAEIKAAVQELPELLKCKERLEWLHSGSGIKDQKGYEWGVARVKFDAQGQLEDVLWTCTDHSDLDAEMVKGKD